MNGKKNKPKGVAMNGWKRLGVVFATLWLIIVAVSVVIDFSSIDESVWKRVREEGRSYQYSGQTSNGLFSYAIKELKDDEVFTNNSQLDSAKNSPTPSTGNTQANPFDNLLDDLIQDHKSVNRLAIVEFKWGYFTFLAFGPVGLAWLAALAFVWVRQGFQKKSTEADAAS
jgi:hypothetical protein